MTTYVHNKTGHLYREIDPTGQVLTITPENKVRLEKGIVLFCQYGENELTVLSKDEVESDFTLLTEDDND